MVSLSNNDSCAVSRSDEAKKIGVKMGQPYFQLKELVERDGLICCSSNYALYQDMSNRIMEVIRRNVPRLEVYSIDEAWVDLSGIPDPEAFGRHLRDEVFRLTGIPVGVGMSNTKTLAKLANWASKKWKVQTGAVVDLQCPIKQEKLLRFADVGEVWGIGRQMTQRLAHMNVTKAWDLATFDKKTLRKAFNVNIERTARELSGEQCMDLVTDLEPKQQIACTRSFGEKVTTLYELQEAVSTFVSRGASKLRAQQHYAGKIQVFIQTSNFDTRNPPYSRSISVGLDYPSADTRDLLNAAQAGLKSIYKDGYRYAKAGIILSELTEPGSFTDDLFAQPKHKNSDLLMGILDSINIKEGRGTVRFGSEPKTSRWSMKRELLSPNFTTSWDETIKVRII